MDYIGCWNTNQTFSGNHQGLLNEGSCAVLAFSIPVQGDNKAIEYAIELSKTENYNLASIHEISGIAPNFTLRKVY